MNYRNFLEQYPVLGQIGQAAGAMGMKVYVIGGFVRDYLLKRNREKFDIDIVAVGSGIALAEYVADQLGRKNNLVVFKNFGTAMFRHEGIDIEFVGARKESYDQSSRKPAVEEGTLEDDQLRRDFTINSMAFSLNSEDYGKLIDPFDGISDLKRKMIKTPLDPGKTFSDDPLRMIRAIRFACQLDFDIDPDTFKSIQDNVERLKIVSFERLSTELTKILMTPRPSYGFKLLFHSGLLKEFFPELVALQGVETVNSVTHKDNFYHTLQVLDNVVEKNGDIWVRWAALLHDIAKPRTKRFDARAGWTFHGHEDLGARMVPGIFKRLRLPLDDRMKVVQKLVRLHLRPIALVDETVTDSAIRRLLFEAGDDIDRLMQLCKADITSKNQNKVTKFLENFEKVEKKIKEVEEKDNLRNFQPPVSGEEIMEYFGIKPSLTVGIIKNEIREAILDGIIHNDREEAFRYMIKAGEKLGLTKNINSDKN